MTLTIRRAGLADAPLIADFNARLAAESERRRLDAARLLRGVEALLASADNGLYWLAEESGGEVVGQLMLTYEWSDWRNGVFWWIQSVYVRQDRRRRGVFSALYRHVAEQARADDGVCGLRLYVDDDNRRAQQTYAALGLETTGYRVLELDLSSEPTRS